MFPGPAPVADVATDAAAFDEAPATGPSPGPEFDGNNEAANEDGVVGNGTEGKFVAVTAVTGILIGSFNFIKSPPDAPPSDKGEVPGFEDISEAAIVACSNRFGGREEGVICLGVSSGLASPSPVVDTMSNCCSGTAVGVELSSVAVVLTVAVLAAPAVLALSRLPHLQLTSHKLALKLSFSISKASTLAFIRL